MAALSRTRGVTGERELRRLLEEQLGVAVIRNLDQAARGGADLLGVPGFAVEAKRARTASPADVARWWRQAAHQAEQAGLAPALAVRADRRPWTVYLELARLRPDLPAALGPEHLVALTVADFAALAREGIG